MNGSSRFGGRMARVLLAVSGVLVLLAAMLLSPVRGAFAADDPVDGCRVYYPADTDINLATAAQDADCWDSSMVSKSGRTFLGWSTERIDDITSGAAYEAVRDRIVTQVTMVEPGVTVYAVWAAMPVLSYDVNAPEGTDPLPETPAPVTVEFNTPAPDGSGWQPGDTGRIPGYTFVGWTDTPGGDDLHDFSVPLTQDVTVHAKWEANGYVVRFDGNADDAAGSMDDQSFTYDVPQQLAGNAFSRPGWEFTGWNTEPDGSGTAYQDRQEVVNLTAQDGGTVTLYAQWERATVRVHYDKNADSATGSHDPTEGEANGTIGIPGDLDGAFSRPGWTLVGWNTRPDGSGTTYRPGGSIQMGVEDVTLYAQWTENLMFMPSTGGTAPGGVSWPLAAGAACVAVALLAAGSVLARRAAAARAGRHAR